MCPGDGGPLWGGRFGAGAGGDSRDFTASISFDARLYRQDIRGSRAHARTLARAGVLSGEELERILAGLDEVEAALSAGEAFLDSAHEDIHTNIEVLLSRRIGPLAGKLHTGRSRNDQVATDMHLFVREEIDDLLGGIRRLQAALVDLACDNVATLLPGYTHMQRAQPVSLAHHLMAYFFMLQRDVGRFVDCRSRADVSPLGAAALAGSGYPLDRAFAAEQLDFSGIYENAMDAVSDRDFVLEFLAAASVAMMHLSRLAEELVLWSTSEFGFLRLGEGYSTGSSIMPQKRNPDSAELIRGKTGRVYGDLMGLLAVMKGLPLAYNSDMQEDKEYLFDATDTLKACLDIAAGIVASLEVRSQRMVAATAEGFLGATDAADYLVRKGLPFREAHRIVGEIVGHCEGEGKDLSDLSAGDWSAFSGHFDPDVVEAVTSSGSVSARDVPGGTAPDRVIAQLAEARGILQDVPY